MGQREARIDAGQTEQDLVLPVGKRLFGWCLCLGVVLLVVLWAVGKVFPVA